MVYEPDVPACWPSDLLDSEKSKGVQWWVLYVKARCEKATARFLRASGESYYLPLEQKISRTKKGRKTISYLPLYSGYLFIAGDEGVRLAALKTNKVSRSIAVEDTSELVSQLRSTHLLLQSGRQIHGEAILEPGDRVKIKRGPMKGVIATLVERRRGICLVVAISSLGQGISIEVQPGDLGLLEFGFH